MLLSPSMYKSVVRTQPWTTASTGYVCKRCRHRLAQQQTHQPAISLVRHESTRTTPAGDTAASDDWLNNFNSLDGDIDFPSKTKQKTRKETAERHGREVERPAIVSRAVSELATKLSNLSKGLAPSGERVAGGEQAAQPKGEKRRSISFGRSNGGANRTSRLPKREQKARGVEMSTSRRIVGSTRSMTRKPSPTMVRAPENAHPPGEMRQQFDSFLGAVSKRISFQYNHPTEEQRIETAGNKTQDEAGATASFGNESTDLATTSTGGTGKSIPRIHYVSGKSLLPHAHKDLRANSGEVSSENISSSTASEPPRYVLHKSGAPVSQIRKIWEAESRPTWGGPVLSSDTPKAVKASYDSLRDADRVSAIPLVQTAGEHTAWGGEIVEKRIGGGDGIPQSRSMVAEKSSSPSSIEELEAELRAHPAKPAMVENDGQAMLGASKETVVNVVSVDEVPTMHNDADQPTISPDDSRKHLNQMEPGPSRQVEGVYVQDKVGCLEADDRVKRLADLHNNDEDEIGGPFSTVTAPKKPGSDSPREPAAQPTKRERRRNTVVRKPSKTPSKTPSEKPSKAGSSTAATSDAVPQISWEDESAVPADQAADDDGPQIASLAPYDADLQDETISTLSADQLQITPLNIRGRPPVPALQYGLDRVLFNQGVYQLQDTHSRVFNFDPYLQNIMPISDFDFNALKAYKTSSQDEMLGRLANEHSKKYVGSTSSMTSTLGHFHYLLSNWRDLNLDMLSKGFDEKAAAFTQINRAPNAIFLRYKQNSGTYAIDADKEYDGANVLMMLGKSMEKLLTLPKDDFERYRRDNTTDPITAAEKDEPEAFEYTTMGDFLMRSQLDAYDARLPGTGMFDLKTRSVVSIRMDAENYEDMLGYEIFTLQGKWESYEREYYDMMRSTMLKYMLQARMGRMDGIFVAYHNIERLFGFQYLPMKEIDRAIHGQVESHLGDQEFRFSLKLMNEALEMATKQFPGKSLRIHFEAVPKPATMMWIFAEPMEEAEIEGIQSSSKDKVAAFEANVMGIEYKPEAPQVDVGAAPTTPGSEVEETNSAADDIVDHSSSNSPADATFLSSLTSGKPEENLKPLFAATLIVQNIVNGVPCEDNRPSKLKRDDKWELQYILKEASTIPLAERWARYEDCKARRRMALTKGDEEEVEGEEGQNGSGGPEPALSKKQKRDKGYHEFLKRMVGNGRRFRAVADELEKGREKVVVGQKMVLSEENDGAGASSQKDDDAQVKDVEGYLAWLYKRD
jgi:hypothetical protein